MNGSDEPFHAGQFTATPWASAEEKASWANAMASWIEHGFPREEWTTSLYRGLSEQMYGHIHRGHMARRIQETFCAEWFDGIHRQLTWLEHAALGAVVGLPTDTWSDVAQAFSAWARSSGLLEQYRRLCAADIEARERAQPAALQVNSVSKLTNERYQIKPERFWLTSRGGGLDGYATMRQARLRGWVPVAIWGRNGWDLGRWPYQVIYHRDRLAGFDLATCVEGDVDVWRFPTGELRDAATDQIAFLFWKEEGQPWLEGIASVDEMPEHLRGPYPSAQVNASERSQRGDVCLE